MALNWNIEKCENYKELTATDEARSDTDAIIWGTMFVGISKITEANYKEFYARYHLIELLNGTFRNTRIDDGTEHGKYEPYYLTLEAVKRRIGLSTNAGTIPRTTFIKMKVGKYFKEIVEAVPQE